MSGAVSCAWAVVSFGATIVSASGTGGGCAGAASAARARTACATRALVPATSMVRPSLPATTPTTVLSRPIRKLASVGSRLIALANAVSAGAAASCATTGTYRPSGVAANEIQLRTVDPGMVQVSLPSVRVTSRAISVAFSTAVAAAASVTDGCNGTSVPVSSICAGAAGSERRRAISSTSSGCARPSPVAAGVVLKPVAVQRAVAFTGGRSIRDAAAWTARAVAATSTVTRGAMSVPLTSVRTPSAALPTGSAKRPTANASSRSPSMSTRRPRSASDSSTVWLPAVITTLPAP